MKQFLCFGCFLLSMFLVSCSGKKDDSVNTDIPMEQQDDVTPMEDGDGEDAKDISEEVPAEEESTDVKSTEIVSPQAAETELTEEKKTYQSMIKASLLQMGNTYRIKKVIEKAEKGEAVAIAYIGGSITEGASSTSAAKSYAGLSYKAFQEQFGSGDGSHIQMVNAGMGGTPSSLGVIRYKRDVLDKLDQLPDIVFIEFAVNDHEEATKGKAYESMIRNILSAENEPAVILVFSVFQSRWNLEDKYRPLGKVYQLPMVSIKQAVVPALDVDKTLTDAEFFADIYHPTDYGHQIMADCINYLFDEIDRVEGDQADIKLPTASYYGSDYDGIIMMDSANIAEDVTLETASFGAKDSSHMFPQNWMHKADSGNEPFSMKVTCKNMLLAFKQSNSQNAGKVEVYVDGEFNQTIDSYSSGGWNNPIVVKLFEHKDSEAHEITIKMAEGNEGKDFTIFTIAYTQ